MISQTIESCKLHCPPRLIRATQSRTWCVRLSWLNNSLGLNYSKYLQDRRTPNQKELKNNLLILPFLTPKTSV